MDCRSNLPELPTSGVLWHIARAQPGYDKMAASALRNRRYLVYRPIIPWRSRRNHGLPRQESCSMFPTYLFVLPNPQGWESLRTAPGMMYGDHALLRINGRIATISHNDPGHMGIAQIREMEEILWNVEERMEGTNWQVGDQVQIRKGPYIELAGKIAGLDESGRKGILVEILTTNRFIYVSPEHIISAEA
jgi:hypothetical protein